MSVQQDHYLQFTTRNSDCIELKSSFKILRGGRVSLILHTFLSDCTSSLLSLVDLVYFILWLLPSTRPLLKSLGIPGQRHVKAIRQKVSEVFFSGHWGESKRLQRSVTKTGRCCIHLHTYTLANASGFTCTHTSIRRQTPTRGLVVTHTLACSAFRKSMSQKNKHTKSMTHYSCLQHYQSHCLTVPSRASSY